MWPYMHVYTAEMDLQGDRFCRLASPIHRGPWLLHEDWSTYHTLNVNAPSTHVYMYLLREAV